MTNNELSAELESFQSDFLFFQREKENLRDKFLNKFIAIKNKEIIESGSSIEEVKTKLEQKDVNPSKVVIEFVPEEEAVMVL